MKIKKGMVFKTCTAILGLIFLIASSVSAQDFLHEDDYDKKTKQDKSVPIEEYIKEN